MRGHNSSTNHKEDITTNQEVVSIPEEFKALDRDQIGKQKLVYKYPFYNFLLKDPILREWPFSDRVLVTAFDLYKDDNFVAQLQRSGQTLKEYLRDEIGLRSNVKILADTGIFELEAKRARLPGFYDAEIAHQLTTPEILDAYDIIDPDFLVAPDEILLLDDTTKVRQHKLHIIEHNLHATMDRFPKAKIYATLQGITTEEIQHNLDIITATGISTVARGGLLPLRKVDKQAYYHVLEESEYLARKAGISYLHAFGMSSTWSLGDYFVENSYDSLDTSAIYWISAKRKFIKEDGRQVPVRKADLKSCGCQGCRYMFRSKYWADTSGRFAIGLYYHNCTSFSSLVSRIHYDPEYRKKYRPWMLMGLEPTPNPVPAAKESEPSELSSLDSLFVPVNQLDAHRKKEGNQSKLHQQRVRQMETIRQYRQDTPSPKVLLLSQCGARKLKVVPTALIFDEIDKLGDRQQMFSTYQHLKVPSGQMYIGSYHDILRKANNLPGAAIVDQVILSAGHGLIRPEDEIVPYDSTFSHKSSNELRQMIDYLNLHQQLQTILKEGYTTIISTLSDTYQEIIQQVLSDLISEDKVQHNSTELVWFTHRQREEVPGWMYYNIEEFQQFHKRKLLYRNPGKLYHARANIAYSYIFELDRGCQDFFDFWHNLFECTCAPIP